MVEREGVQVPQWERGVDMPAEEIENQEYASQTGEVARNCGTHNSKRGNRSEPVDQDEVAADVDKVDDDRNKHGLAGQAVCAEERHKGQMDCLKRHPKPDDAQIGAGLLHQLFRYPHQPENLPRKDSQSKPDS